MAERTVGDHDIDRHEVLDAADDDEVGFDEDEDDDFDGDEEEDEDEEEETEEGD